MSNLPPRGDSQHTQGAPPPLPSAEQHVREQGSKRNLGAIGGALVAIGLLLAKFKFLLVPVLKFFPLIFKTGGTMILSIFFYAQSWGWWFATGFVLLILVHECGHLVMARQFGLNVGWPVFIPFMGAVIALKDAPKNAWIEAWVGIGGPLLGTLGAVACDLIFLATGEPIFRALAVVRPNLILFLIVALALPRLAMLFRKKTDEEKRFFELSAHQRLTMAFFYFGLVGFLVMGMQFSHIAPLKPEQTERITVQRQTDYALVRQESAPLQIRGPSQ